MSFFGDTKKGMTLFGSGITTIVNTVLLAIVYFLGVGLTALVARITGKKFLKMKLDKEANTYWEELNIKKKPLKDYYRQF